ncbi:MAG: transporter substrate-binding domain-containing protein, partial [Pseudomonadota bacterium]|nr:transporter substrate-binding domain-containing protein [Pseudomonadota bacterium]
LRVAIDTTTPPYASLDSAMAPQGLDIDFARLLAKSLGTPIEFVTVNSPGRIPALLTKRVDMVISIFSITPERALQVAFSNPYAGQSSVLVAPKSRAIKGPEDLKGLKVAVTRGAMEDIVLTGDAKTVPGMTILRFDDYPSTAQAMLSGQVDAMGGGDYGDIYLKKSASGDAFEQKFALHAFHFGVGIRRGNPDLLHWINTFIYFNKNDGTLNDLSMKWRNKPAIDLPTF